MNQDVTEHKVANRRSKYAAHNNVNDEMDRERIKRGTLQMTTRLTRRAVANLLAAVQEKLQRMVSELSGGEFSPEDVRQAL